MSSAEIPFVDLAAQQRGIREKLDARIRAVLDHGQYIQGPEVVEFEAKLAAWVGVRHCIAVANGTDALQIALMALGVGPGDEVITPPFTFAANAEVIALLGAKIVFADIDPKTYNIDPKRVKEAITERTKAILPVSLFGQCADLDALNAIGKEYGIPVIEDAAQSLGATSEGRQSCSMTTIACTSFFPSKPLGCYGDGGACFTNDSELATRIRWIRTHGQDRRYHHAVLGVNSRLDTLQAAILLTKLEIFDFEVKARAEIGAKYGRLLEGTSIAPPWIAPGNTSVYAQYTLQSERREALLARLKEARIPTAVHYPIPLHLQPAFSGLALREGDFPNSEAAAKRVFSIPMHPYLSEADQRRIVEVLARSHD